MLENEKNAFKREDKSRDVERIALIEEYKKEKNLELLFEKTLKSEEKRYLSIHIENKRLIQS
jgi:hypothetical protein